MLELLFPLYVHSHLVSTNTVVSLVSKSERSTGLLCLLAWSRDVTTQVNNSVNTLQVTQFSDDLSTYGGAM